MKLTKSIIQQEKDRAFQDDIDQNPDHLDNFV